MDDNADPSAGIMNVSILAIRIKYLSNNNLFKLMKKMYEDGDDEMKRTIAKAWTEGQDKKNGPPMPMM